MQENQSIFSSLLNNELRSLLSDDSLIEGSIFVTLRYSSKNKGIGCESYLCDSTCRHNYDHFWNIINSHLFGRKYKKTKRKTEKYQLRHLSVLHQHADPRRSHVHSIIASPPDISRQYLKSLVSSFWQKTHFGWISDKSHWSLHIKDIYSQGVLRYPLRDQGEYEPYILGSYLGSGKASDLISF